MTSSPGLVRDLTTRLGRTVELTFSDGFVAHVRLLAVDPDEEPLGLIYHLVKVVAYGPIDPATINWRAAHAAAIGDVVAWAEIAENAT